LVVSVKVVKQGKDTLVAACDAELLGKTLKFGKIDFPVRREFYEGQILTPEETMQEIRNGTTVNLLGEKIVGQALKAGLIHPEAVLYVSGIPHALIVRI
jgi:hypothetical protein